jgi:hypothetical protein
LLQERAPVAARGRVFAVQFSLANLFSVIPLLSIGGLADVLGVGRVILAIAVVLMAIAIWTSRFQFESEAGEGARGDGVPVAIDGESRGSL